MAKRPVALPGGELERSVLAALWQLEGASAPEIHARSGAPRGLVYTTTAKVLDRLHAKRLVRRKAARFGDGLRKLLGPEPKPSMATIVDTWNPSILRCSTS